jgi:hypothetical protein
MIRSAFDQNVNRKQLHQPISNFLQLGFCLFFRRLRKSGPFAGHASAQLSHHVNHCAGNAALPWRVRFSIWYDFNSN